MNVSLTRFLRKLRNRIFGAELGGFRPHRHLFEGRTGLEIGGPSRIFRRDGHLPVYPHALRVDGVNFSTRTVWEGKIRAGLRYRYAWGKVGHQYVCEGSRLETIPDHTYDFVLSSHSLEHSANPMKAIAEWKRVLKPGGAMLLVLPDKRFTFDHRRAVTAFEHLQEDYRNDTKEDDLTHLEEILALHDGSMDRPSRDPVRFRARSLKNFENRCLHQHVFDHELLGKVFEHFAITPRYSDSAPPWHLILLGNVS